jgi:hypothetical protein
MTRPLPLVRLSPNQFAWHTISVPGLSPANYHLAVTLDSKNQIGESNEFDNVSTVDFVVFSAGGPRRSAALTRVEFPRALSDGPISPVSSGSDSAGALPRDCRDSSTR